MNIIKYFIIFLLNCSIIKSYITNANFVIKAEQNTFNTILEKNNLCCHLQSSRIKTFSSAMNKLSSMKSNDIYDIHDLIAFRYVFYENTR